MNLYPAIDLYGGQAVRLYQGDYDRMTVYHPDPVAVAREFEKAGAKHLHLVDLEGARSGNTANLPTIRAIVAATDLFVEVGGGIRDLDAVERYLALGVDRVILGTAAVTDPAFLEQAVKKYAGQIAVGVDLRDGFVAIRGWTEKTAITAQDFFRRMERMGVKTVICTDISRDGAMAGTNRELYRRLQADYAMDLIASGGVSDLQDVVALKQMGLSGAIIGKAYYIGAIDLREAVEAAR